MELFLVRHGETDANVQGIIQGQSETSLNDNGQRQAEEAATNFTEPVDAIFASDLLRTKQTAAAFTAKLNNVPYFEDARLRERDFKLAVGQHRTKEQWQAFWRTGEMPNTPGAETINEFNARVASFLKDLTKTHYRRVLIVTHGGTINRFLALNNQAPLAPHNTGITHITIAK